MEIYPQVHGGWVKTLSWVVLAAVFTAVASRIVDMIEDQLIRDLALLGLALLVPGIVAGAAALSMIQWLSPKYRVNQSAGSSPDRPGEHQLQYYQIKTRVGDTERPYITEEERRQDEFSERAVRIEDLMNDKREIVRKKLTRCTVIGPAILNAIGDTHVQRRPFDDCTWNLNRWEMFQVQGSANTKGVITLRDSFFDRCYFDDVVFRLKQSEVDAIIAEAGANG